MTSKNLNQIITNLNKGVLKSNQEIFIKNYLQPLTTQKFGNEN